MGNRRQEIQAILSQYRVNLTNRLTLTRLGAMLALLAGLIALTGYLNQYHQVLVSIQILSRIFENFYANVSSELVSIVITVLIVDRLSRAREKREQAEAQRRLDKRELQRLKALLRSNERAVTGIALAELGARGWLADGSLRGADLRNSNLQGADLRNANLQKVDLSEANLQRVDLRDANLQGADLRTAKLQGANLRVVNLQGATLLKANLQNANLIGGKLQGANLHKANLQNADMFQASLREVDLGDANLQKALFIETNLQGSDLRNANLQEADLSEADLQGVNFVNAKLRGTDFRQANLQHANIHGVKWDETTRLPNGKKWTSQIDLLQFGTVEIEDWFDFLSYKREHRLDGIEAKAFKREHGLLDDDDGL